MSTCLNSLHNPDRVVKSRGPGNLADRASVPGLRVPGTLSELERGPLFTLPQPPGLIISPFTGELNTRLQKPLITSCQWLFLFTIE
jgi:hypothetical protein